MKVFDISLPMNSELVVWPGDPPIEIKSVANIAKGDSANISRIKESQGRIGVTRKDWGHPFKWVTPRSCDPEVTVRANQKGEEGRTDWGVLQGIIMKAIALYQGERDSIHLRGIKKPIPSEGEALVKVLDVGICGTDREIIDGLYGESPEGSDFLILGHENLGIVEKEIGGFKKGELVVATVRRPCPENCLNCSRGENDMCLTGNYKERGIKGLHGYMTEYYAEEPAYLVKIPPELKDVAVLLEPLSIVEKAIEQAFRIQRRLEWEPKNALVLGAGPVGILATLILRNMGLATFTYVRSPRGNLDSILVEKCGAAYISASDISLSSIPAKIGNIDIIIEAAGDARLSFEAVCILGRNGILALTGITGREGKLEISADCINLEIVLGNKVVFGAVNANKRDFDSGVRHLKEFQEKWPGLLNGMITRRVSIEDFKDAIQKKE